MHFILRYESSRAQYMRILDMYNAALTQKEMLFQRTQPKGIQIKPDKIEGSGGSNPLEEYMIRKDELKLDRRIEEARAMLQYRDELLQKAERDLRASRGTWDVIYVYRYLDNRTVHWIAKKMNYSQRNVYMILEKIRRKSAKYFSKADI